jgi:tellurite resistance protein
MLVPDTMSNKRIERLRDKLLERGMDSQRPPPMNAEPRPEVVEMAQRVRPFAEAMYLVLAADGGLRERERDVLRGALRTLTDGLLSSSAMDAMLSKFERERAIQGLDMRLDAVAAALYSDRSDSELALSLMAAAGETDGRLTAAEQSIIIALGQRLGLSQLRLNELLYGAEEPASA